ncbi:LysR family transcriptional regulator [Actinorhabdospora filicis]|uniref:LysR family transcriptional regulator n=1 Tax=Actinorhabdospora filicis TaxID=1785913 RepID=A0A9W6SHY5_9ACTN|nr:LysR family substrate-binding domain-containing protein [Actinorhabdospora filicis]GLZ76305.1 LysR family transcriptional regulator [Actinorhabdospora filicis]
MTDTFRLAYVPGATPAKWARVWETRLPDVPLELIAMEAAEALDAVKRGDVHAGLVRAPLDKTGLNAIPLYTEVTVVMVPKGHVVTAVEELTCADLDDEIVFHPLDDTLPWDATPPGKAAVERPATTADAVDLVEAGIGVLVVPQSVARFHHRPEVRYRPVTDAVQAGVALAWPEGETGELMEELIGIVRGRTANSSRGRGAGEQSQQPAKSATKTAAKAQGAKGQGGGKTQGGKAQGGKGQAGKARQGGKPVAKKAVAKPRKRR